MRWVYGIGGGFLLVVVSLVLITRWYPHQVQHYSDLPWQIEVIGEDRTRVLGLTLGETTLASLAGRLPVPDIRLFVDPDGERSVEAYYSNARIPPFEANLVLIPQLDATELEELWEQRTSERPMPSGARRYGLRDAALIRLGGMPVAELSYIPRARWDEEQVLARFGPPESRLQLDNAQVYWLYPEQGLVITVPARRGRMLMHYVTLDRWDQVLDRLERARLREAADTAD